MGRYCLHGHEYFEIWLLSSSRPVLLQVECSYSPHYRDLKMITLSHPKFSAPCTPCPSPLQGCLAVYLAHILLGSVNRKTILLQEQDVTSRNIQNQLNQQVKIHRSDESRNKGVVADSLDSKVVWGSKY